MNEDLKSIYIEQITDEVTQFLTNTEWSDEDKRDKLNLPTMRLWGWDTEAYLRAYNLNDVFSEENKLTVQELKTLVDTACLKVTNERLEALRNVPLKSFAQLMTAEYPEARFCIEPFFEQGTMNMISAPPNSWKSWLVFLMARHIADGSDLLGKFRTEQTGVMIVNEEDTERLIADRFRALGIQNQNLPMYFRVAHGSKLDQTYCASLLLECKEKNITVIMFDSLRSLHDADENSSTAMQPIMDNMKMLTREGITVVFTHHHKKKNALDRGDSAESSRGSSAINAAISGHISLEEVEREGEKYIVVRHLKSKVTQKIEPFDIKITIGDGTVSLSHTGEHQDTTRVAEIARQGIYDHIKKNRNRWIGVKEIVDMKISSEKYIRMALSGMRVNGLIQCATKTYLMDSDPTLRLVGAKNAKFYKYVEHAEEIDESNKEADSSWELL